MLLLLPPSEGKAPAPADAAPVDLAALTAPEALTARRELVLAALAQISARPDATAVLGVGKSLAAEVARNTTLRQAPAAPAKQIYAGVLFAAAGLGALAGAAAARAQESVRVVSALWGVVAPDDRIPAYRLSMCPHLPGVGPLAGGWQAPVGQALDDRARGEVVIDCRSTPYQAAWRPPREADWVNVRVVRETNGRRTVVSHNAKHTRGVLVRHLLRRDSLPVDADSLLGAAGELVGQVVGTEVGTGLSYTVVEATLSPRVAGRRQLELVID